MPYTEIKTYQQNFLKDETQISSSFNFKPLTKTKLTNKWKIRCSHITIGSLTTDVFEGHCVWLSNCPLLSGFGFTEEQFIANPTLTSNNILLGSENVTIKVQGVAPNETIHTNQTDFTTTGTTFIVDEIKQDPFTILLSYIGSPFTLDLPISAIIFITFDITEIERD